MSFPPKPCIFRFLNANKNVVMVCPLRKIIPQTTASPNRDENTHGSHSATELILFVCLGFSIILACKEIYNGVFLHPPPAPYNWLNAKEVIYFKEIIKGVKSLKKFFLLGFPGAPLRTQRTSCIRLRENKKGQVEKVLYSQISFTIYDRF